MAFCDKGTGPIKEFLSHLTDGIETAAEAALSFTKDIKAIEQSPTIQGLEAIVGNAVHVDIKGAVAQAFQLITGIETTVENLANNLSEWLTGETSLQNDANLIKLASVTTSIHSQANGEPVKPESFYDTVVQTHSLTNPSLVG